MANLFKHCNLYEQALAPSVAHGGIGRVLSKRLVTRDSVSGRLDFIDYCVLPPGTSIGVHTHSMDEEEYYLVQEGRGLIFRDGESFEVGSGDLIRNRPGGTHGLRNIGTTELRLFVFEVEAVVHGASHSHGRGEIRADARRGVCDA